MKVDVGHMNFFDVDLCGLYKPGNETNYGCDLKETFDLISDWVSNRSFPTTIPWDPASENRNKAKCYCKDIFKNKETGDYFIVLWKSDTDSAGTLWGAPENSTTGSNKVIKYTSGFQGEKVIWGRPCYYWIIPEFNTVVSIKFDHSVCDAQLFEDYIKSCINNRVKHKNRKKEVTEKGFVRITHEKSDGSRLMYRFNISLKSLNTSSSELQGLAKSVTHIVRRETIIVDSKDEKNEWIKMFNKVIPLVPTKPKAKKRKIEIQAEAKPSAHQIKKIIEENAKENRKNGEWNNIGFKTESGVYWVDKYRLRDNITVLKKSDDILTGKQLCKEIMKDRERYIRPIRRSIKESSKKENLN
ncbi:hypothetical protein [Pleionea sp. CnH1-48]|uniref:hypothetical protein n=1 Tax=Pleionea sp. CnH1-48 TaxID=2954494 RepID=UPI0020980395|nr:hypothetical protein [Pleionea sp. CnH1-48]MCO7223147.1 hypothetical protein [Pleionea sp. CnH1-48]